MDPLRHRRRWFFNVVLSVIPWKPRETIITQSVLELAGDAVTICLNGTPLWWLRRLSLHHLTSHRSGPGGWVPGDPRRPSRPRAAARGSTRVAAPAAGAVTAAVVAGRRLKGGAPPIVARAAAANRAIETAGAPPKGVNHGASAAPPPRHSRIETSAARAPVRLKSASRRPAAAGPECGRSDCPRH